MLHISSMHGTGISSTSPLNTNREYESMSEENVDVAYSPDSVNTILKNLCLANFNRLICTQLKINSIINKFESLREIVSTNVGFLLICETKLDLPFPRAQFHIHSSGERYRFCRNGKGGGILLCILLLPSKLIESQITIKDYSVEIHLRKMKWFLFCSYNSKRSLISNYLRGISNNLDLLLSKYDNSCLLTQNRMNRFMKFVILKIL